MMPHQPRSTLFPYTTLFRSGGVCLLADRSALAGSAARMIDLVQTMVNEVEVPLHEAVAMATENPARAVGLERKGRSEEHTSELQSPYDLVCRLLLEKKKTRP